MMPRLIFSPPTLFSKLLGELRFGDFEVRTLVQIAAYMYENHINTQSLGNLNLYT